MKINFKCENKRYAEILPSISISWRKPTVICMGWLVFFMFIEF